MALKSCYTEHLIEAGLDEAGRGCLAGPVVAAAVILGKNFNHEGLNDSKKLTPRQRDQMEKVIKSEALAWTVAEVSNDRIDKINILQASIEAMNLCIQSLIIKPQLLLIDGNRFFTDCGIQHLCVVKGDSIYKSIAAASILAKTHRDKLMKKYHAMFPHYGWLVNKGYPTSLHREAIYTFGPCSLHRKSFNLYGSGKQLCIDFG